MGKSKYAGSKCNGIYAKHPLTDPIRGTERRWKGLQIPQRRSCGTNGHKRMALPYHGWGRDHGDFSSCMMQPMYGIRLYFPGRSRNALLCGGGTAQKNSDFQGTGFRSGTDPPCVRLIKYKGRRCYRRYISAWCFYTRETMSPSPSLWRILSRPSTAIWRTRSRHFPTMRGLRLAVSDVVILSSRSKERSGLETNRPSTCRTSTIL